MLEVTAKVRKEM